MARRAAAAMVRSPTGSPPLEAVVVDGEGGAELAQAGQEAGAQWAEADALDGDARAGDEEGGDEGEGGRGGVAGDGDVAGAQLGLAVEMVAQAAALERFGGEGGAEMAEHVLGVVAGGDGLVDPGAAAGVEAGEEEGGLDLGRGDLEAVLDGQGVAGALDGERQAAALAGGEAGAGLGERDGDPAHGAAAQAGVAGHDGEDRVGGQQAGEQAGGGAGIAHVEDVAGLGEGADAAAGDAPGRAVAGDVGAEGAHGGGGAEHVLALEEAVDRGLADGEAGEHQGAMADRLVAGDADAAGQGRWGGADVERAWGHARRRIAWGRRFDSAARRWHGRALPDDPLRGARFEGSSMVKPELGMKRVCVSCSTRFYDLSRNPAVCPKCGTEQPVEQPRVRRTSGNLIDEKRVKKPLPVDDADPETEGEETEEAAEDEDDVLESTDDLEDDTDAIGGDIEVEGDREEEG